MIAFVLAFFMMVAILLLGFAFLSWVIREHLVARKYRHLLKLHAKLPAANGIHKGSPQWTVTFKEKGKVKTIIVSGATEALAIKELVNSKNVPYGSIISSVKL